MQVEEKLKRLRYVQEKKGMKDSCTKTKYMCINERDPNGRVKLQREE